MFGKKEIEFTTHFTSPVFGNVYSGKVVTIAAKDADKYIAAGVAKVVGEAPAAPKVVIDPYAGMNKKQKEAAIKAAKEKEEKEKADAAAADLAEKQARLDVLLAQDKLTDAEQTELDALEAVLKVS